MSSIVRSGQHTFRERETPNADPLMTVRNQCRGAKSSAELAAAVKRILPAKLRKNSVLAIEYLITASPGAFRRHGGELDEFGSGLFSDAVRWLKRRHGAGNVVCSAVHLDETTPHLIAYVVPLTQDGRLSCRDFLGTPRKMREMQDDFYRCCASYRGLERGVVGSKAKHQTIRGFYSALSKVDQVPTLSRGDHLAAACGIRTARRKEADSISMANSRAAIVARGVKKTQEARLRAMDIASKALEAALKEQAAVNAELQRAKRLADTELRRLQEREKAIAMDEARVLRIEAENEALRRAVKPIELLSRVSNTRRSLDVSSPSPRP